MIEFTKLGLTAPDASIIGVIEEGTAALNGAALVREYESGAPSAGVGRQARRPGNEQRTLSEAEQRRARDWVDTQSLKIARELLEKRVCANCHEVTRVPDGVGLEQWRVEPVQLTADWMPRARFDHGPFVQAWNRTWNRTWNR